MRKTIFTLLRYSGIPFLLREIVQRKRVTIVMFHNPSVESVEQSIKYFSKRYNIISLNDFIKANQLKDSSFLPKKALIVTFDDGHIGNYNLLPYFRKYNFIPTIFLCASIVGTKKQFWFNFLHPSKSEIDLAKISNTDRLEYLSKKGYRQEQEYENCEALTKELILEMIPFVDFQSHTLSHPYLPMCNDVEAEKEILESKHILESVFKLTITSIAYPNGDYTNRDIQIVKKAKYLCGITVDGGYNNVMSDIFRLKRLSVNDTEDINELIVKTSGLWAFIKRHI